MDRQRSVSRLPHVIRKHLRRVIHLTERSHVSSTSLPLRFDNRCRPESTYMLHLADRWHTAAAQSSHGGVSLSRL